MAEDAWTILGLAPTPDAAAIRRAYAARLKALRPETDPEAFQRLLAARAAALREAGRLQEPPAAGAAAAATGRSDPPPPGPAPPSDAVVERIVEARDAESVRRDPQPRILVREVDLAPLEADRVHWETARGCAAAFEKLLSDAGRPIDLRACRKLFATTAGLPRGPRDEVEAVLVQLLARGLRPTGPMLDRRWVRWIRPLLAEAEPIFDWLGDDAVITSTLEPADASAFCALARDTSLAADPHRRSLHPVRPGAWPGLADADARAFLRGSARRHLAVYETFRAKGRLHWRLDGLACAMPAVWAARHRSLILFLPAFAASWGAFALANLGREHDAWLGIASAILYSGLSLGYGLGADRLLLWVARRVARRASRKLIYSRRARDEYLMNKSMLPSAPVLGIFYFLGIVVCFAPYTALVMLLDMAIQH